jgi:hypothetical protein
MPGISIIPEPLGWIGWKWFGVLGYATFPGTDIPANQGVFINALSWGNNSCYVIPEFGLGRTLVHEVGHYFGLYHIWGDDGGAAMEMISANYQEHAVPANLLLVILLTRPMHFRMFERR